MIQSLFNKFFGAAPCALTETDARVALAALLVRVARADDDYAPAEIARIDTLLQAHYGLSPKDAQVLRLQAQSLEAEAPDNVRFTRAIKNATPLEARSGLMQSLWSVALVDGAREDEEDQLMRILATLLGLSDVESALARQRVIKG